MITTSLEAALLFMTIEFGMLAVVITFLLYRGARTTEADTTAQATDLVSKVSNTEDSRRVALQTVFKDKYQFEGDELTAAVDEFMQREKAFYNAVVGAFLGRGNKKISDLNDELTKVVAPWISITPKNMVDRATAESLAVEKSEVETELGETKQVLEKMISEYNRAFHIEPDGEVSPEATDNATDDEKTDESDPVDGVLFSVDLADGETDDHDDAETADPGLTSDMIEELDDDDIVAATVESPADAEQADDPEPVSDMIEELDDDDIVAATAESPADAAQTDDLGPISETIEELDDDDSIVGAAETQVGPADKPMTADDLDDLMESLEAEPLVETETA